MKRSPGSEDEPSMNAHLRNAGGYRERALELPRLFLLSPIYPFVFIGRGLVTLFVLALTVVTK